MDSSFGINGRAATNTPDGGIGGINKIIVLPDGKILAVGIAYPVSPNIGNIALVRYENDGSVDSSFGTNGIVFTTLNVNLRVSGAGVDENGHIIVAGNTIKNYNDLESTYVVKYNADGSLDKSFANGGIKRYVYEMEVDIRAVKIQQDNKILVAGRYEYLSAYSKFMVTRYMPDGTPDNSFGNNGIATIGFDENVLGLDLYDMQLQPDGKILTAGYIAVSRVAPYTPKHTVIARFNADGKPDAGFGINGYTITKYTDFSSEIRSIVVQPNGKIVGAGAMYLTTGNGANADFALVQYTDRGIVDSSFGENGTTVTPIEGTAWIYGAALQDNKIIAAGYTNLTTPPSSPFVVARYFGDTEGPGNNNPKYVRIKKWLHRYGFTWNDFPGRNISYYAVQRSSNGNSFTEIARLFSRNNQQQFSYADAAPLTGDNYYRLAAVSADGAVTYSNVLAISNNTATVKVYPNPAKNNLQIEGLSATEKTKLVISDLNGVARMSAVANSSSYNWNISSLKPGNYILRITNGSNVVTKKFLKE